MPTETKNRAGQRLPCGDEVGHRLVTELAAGDDHATEEGSERQGDSGERREPRRAEADQEDGEDEQLAFPRAGHEAEQARHDDIGGDQHAGEDRRGGADRHQHVDDRASLDLRGRAPPGSSG